jgi:hypothetical protein
VADRGVVGVLVAILDHWGTFGVLLAMSALVFGYVVPKSKVPVFAEAAPEVPRKVLDEYFWTWTPDVARRFLSGIGPNGRPRLRRVLVECE